MLFGPCLIWHESLIKVVSWILLMKTLSKSLQTKEKIDKGDEWLRDAKSRDNQYPVAICMGALTWLHRLSLLIKWWCLRNNYRFTPDKRGLLARRAKKQRKLHSPCTMLANRLITLVWHGMPHYTPFRYQ